MLKLTKYEFLKNKTVLLIIFIGIAILESAYLICCHLKDVEKTALTLTLCVVYTSVCFFVVFVLAISNYSKELNSKSSFLIFMTPNSSLSIIFSKMLTTLITGCVIAAILCGLAYFDVWFLSENFPKIRVYKELINIFSQMAAVEIAQLALTVSSYVIDFLISFFATVTLIYLAITLSFTLLQNARMRGFISFLIFFFSEIALNMIRSRLPSPYTFDEITSTYRMLMNLLPGALLDLIVMILCIFGCTKLLDKHLSL